jgi:hypothetical protein
MDIYSIIHENDRWMVRDKDLRSISKLSLPKIEQLMRQDDTFRMTHFMMYLDDGMTSDEAAKAVRRAFPTYYLDPDTRSFDGMESDDDAHLPFAMKKRLGPLKLVKVKKNISGSHGSFNACVRDMVKKNKL